jgi:hypothetical protein
MSTLIPPSDGDLQRFMLYRRSTAVSQISLAARDIQLTEKALSLSRESLRLALELYDTGIPETHIDHDTYVRSLIYAYQNLGTFLSSTAEGKAEAQVMFEKSLELSEQLFSQTRRESSQVGVLVKDSLMLILSLASLENDRETILKFLPKIKTNENLLSEEDRKLVFYYESKVSSLLPKGREGKKTAEL